jgi:hypothetical protein
MQRGRPRTGPDDQRTFSGNGRARSTVQSNPFSASSASCRNSAAVRSSGSTRAKRRYLNARASFFLSSIASTRVRTNKAAGGVYSLTALPRWGRDGQLPGADDHCDRGPLHNETRGLSLTSALQVISGRDVMAHLHQPVRRSDQRTSTDRREAPPAEEQPSRRKSLQSRQNSSGFKRAQPLAATTNRLRPTKRS